MQIEGQSIHGVRIAMWSGPRNISTALMRAWENRPDTVVFDEPFYAHYLKQTGKSHPMAEEIIQTMETDSEMIAASLLKQPDRAHQIAYQKQMAHHLLDSVPRNWFDQVRHAFLIRDPRAMVPSLMAVTPNASLEDTGLPQQVRLYIDLMARGIKVPIVESRELLINPRKMLEHLCQTLDVSFSDKMLKWPAGSRATDGPWAPHWYANVEKSTGFGPAPEVPNTVPEQCKALVEQCWPYYEPLFAQRLKV